MAPSSNSLEKNHQIVNHKSVLFKLLSFWLTLLNLHLKGTGESKRTESRERDTTICLFMASFRSSQATNVSGVLVAKSEDVVNGVWKVVVRGDISQKLIFCKSDVNPYQGDIRSDPIFQLCYNQEEWVSIGAIEKRRDRQKSTKEIYFCHLPPQSELFQGLMSEFRHIIV